MIKPQKLNPNYYKWAIAAQSNAVNAAYQKIIEIQGRARQLYWNPQGTLTIPEHSHTDADLDNAQLEFENAIKRLESLKQASRDFHPDGLYIITDEGELVRVKKGGHDDTRTCDIDGAR